MQPVNHAGDYFYAEGLILRIFTLAYATQLSASGIQSSCPKGKENENEKEMKIQSRHLFYTSLPVLPYYPRKKETIRTGGSYSQLLGMKIQTLNCVASSPTH